MVVGGEVVAEWVGSLGSGVIMRAYIDGCGRAFRVLDSSISEGV